MGFLRNIYFSNVAINLRRNIHGFGKIQCTIHKSRPVLSTTKRNIFSFFRRPTTEQLKIKDNVPDSYQLIYKNTMERYLLGTQIFGSVTSVIVCLAVIWNHDFTTYSMNYDLWKNKPKKVRNEELLYVTSFLAFAVFLYAVVAKMPVRIYYMPKKKDYTFVFMGGIPFSVRKLHCKVGSVKKLPEKGILPWNDCKYIIDDEHRILLLDQCFRRPADLGIMMGYQKDVDVD